MTKTEQAMALLAADPELGPVAAAKAAGISYTVLYRALKRPRCPACGGWLKDGQVVQTAAAAATAELVEAFAAISVRWDKSGPTARKNILAALRGAR